MESTHTTVHSVETYDEDRKITVKTSALGILILNFEGTVQQAIWLDANDGASRLACRLARALLEAAEDYEGFFRPECGAA